MAYIFEINDKTKRFIRLTEERWKHITKEHPEVTDIEEIKETVKKPFKIKESKYDPNHVVWFYRLNKNRKRYLFVAVKYLNGDGFVITIDNSVGYMTSIGSLSRNNSAKWS